MTRRRRSEVAGVVSTLAGAVLLAALWAVVVFAWLTASDLASARRRSEGVPCTGVLCTVAAGRRRKGEAAPLVRGLWVEVGRWLYFVGQHGGVQTPGGPCGPGCHACHGTGPGVVCVVCRLAVSKADGVVDAAGVVRCGPCAARRRQVEARDAIVASARRNPWQVSDADMARATAAKRARWREHLPCPLCGEGRGCRCTARELAVFTARQGTLPGVDTLGPSMPATPGAQGRLF